MIDMELMERADVLPKETMDVLFKKSLSIYARFLHVALKLMDKSEAIKHDELMEITGFSVSTVKKALKELESNDMISVKRGQYGSFYEVM
jgi:predicted transcriptional regulator